MEKFCPRKCSRRGAVQVGGRPLARFSTVSQRGRNGASQWARGVDSITARGISGCALILDRAKPCRPSRCEFVVQEPADALRNHESEHRRKKWRCIPIAGSREIITQKQDREHFAHATDTSTPTPAEAHNNIALNQRRHLSQRHLWRALETPAASVKDGRREALSVFVRESLSRLSIAKGSRSSGCKRQANVCQIEKKKLIVRWVFIKSGRGVAEHQDARVCTFQSHQRTWGPLLPTTKLRCVLTRTWESTVRSSSRSAVRFPQSQHPYSLKLRGKEAAKLVPIDLPVGIAVQLRDHGLHLVGVGGKGAQPHFGALRQKFGDLVYGQRA